MQTGAGGLVPEGEWMKQKKEAEGKVAGRGERETGCRDGGEIA